MAIPVPEDAVEPGRSRKKIRLRNESVGDAHIAPQNAGGIIGIALPEEQHAAFRGAIGIRRVAGADVRLGEIGMASDAVE